MAKGPRSGFYYALAAFLVVPAGFYGPDVVRLTAGGKVITFAVCLGLSLALILIGAAKELAAEAKEENAKGHTRRMIAIGGMLVCGIGFLIFGGIYFWPSDIGPTQPAQATVPAPLLASQIEEMTRLQRFLGNGQEGQLRQLFDFPDMIYFNTVGLGGALFPISISPTKAAQIKAYFVDSVVSADPNNVPSTVGPDGNGGNENHRKRGPR
jgi:hypothetical protein